MDEAARSHLNRESGLPYYDREGKPIGMGDWIAMREDVDYIYVNRTVLPNGLYVSTVWLGLDHSFGFPGDRALIFESMVFGPKWADGEWFLPMGWHWLDDLDQRRYSTETEALHGHGLLCVEWAGVTAVPAIPA